LKYSHKFAGLVLALGTLVPLAPPQESRISHEGGAWTQQSSGSMSSAKNLRVKVDMGSIRIRGTSQPGVRYESSGRTYDSSEEHARHELNSYKINASVKGDTAWIVAEWQGGRPHKSANELVIDLPRETDSVTVETDGGGIDVSGITGRVNAQSGGGKIKADDIGGSLTAETGGDSIEIGAVGGALNLQTGGGRIYVGAAKSKVIAETGGGDVVLVSAVGDSTVDAGGGNIQVKQCGGRLKVSTGGGNIELGDIGGPVDIETGGGSIKLGSAKGRVTASTGAGSIELYGVPSARAETGSGGITVKFVGAGGERHDSELETAMGDVTVYLAQDLAMTVRANVDLANGHTIRSDFSDILVHSEGGQWGPKTITAEGRLNGGGAVLKIHTTTGDIWFKRMNR